jgi:hypothetical protein
MAWNRFGIIFSKHKIHTILGITTFAKISEIQHIRMLCGKNISPVVEI